MRSSVFFRSTAGTLVTADGVWRCAQKLACAPVDRWILKLWEIDGACPPARERELPRGDVSLIVNLAGRHAIVDPKHPARETVFDDAWVTGLHETAFITASGGRAWLCGARFTVEGAYRFLGVAPREIANTLVHLDTLHGSSATRLVDEIRTAATADLRLSILGDYIIEQAARNCRWDVAVAWALNRISASHGCVPVASIAREIGWSRKHLHRRFVDQVGIAPKSCAKVARFHSALLALESVEEERLASTAQRLGYFDQAHLAREFRAIAGLTITEYQRARGYSIDYGFARESASHSSKS